MNILFICTANKNRSKTAEVHFQSKYPEFDIKSAGTNEHAVRKYGGVLVDAEMLNQAEVIACMEQEHADYIQGISKGYLKKIEVLGIPDIYQFMADDLIEELESKFKIPTKRNISAMSTTKEKRILHVADQSRHTRAFKDTKGNKVLEGYASVFNQRSRLIFEGGEIFNEVIERGAFDKVLASSDLDVILTYQHNQDEPLARLNKKRGIKNLSLTADSYGLKFRATLNNTSGANDTWARVSSGDCFECSFVFTVLPEGERWARAENGTPLRYVSKVNSLHDVSIVVSGAYANTDVAAAERSFKQNIGKPKENWEYEVELDRIILKGLGAK